MDTDIIVLGDTPDAWLVADFVASRGARAVIVRPVIGPSTAPFGVGALLAAGEFGGGGDAFHKVTCGPLPLQEIWHVVRDAHDRWSADVSKRHGIPVYSGPARFKDGRSIEVFHHGAVTTISAKIIVIALGTIARRSYAGGTDQNRILVPEDFARTNATPERLAILGGNRTACACARVLRGAGVDVTLIDSRPVAENVDIGVSIVEDDVMEFQTSRESTSIRFASGRDLKFDGVLFATDRIGATQSIGLARAGLEADDRGRLWCDDQAMTWIPSIAAVGEVIGYPKHLREGTELVIQTIERLLRLDAPVVEAEVSIRFEAANGIPRPHRPRSRRVPLRKRHASGIRLYRGNER